MVLQWYYNVSLDGPFATALVGPIMLPNARISPNDPAGPMMVLHGTMMFLYSSCNGPMMFPFARLSPNDPSGQVNLLGPLSAAGSYSGLLTGL